MRSLVDQAQAERRSVRVYGLNAAGRALLHQECASRRLSHVTSGDKSFMTFWHEDWSPRKSSEALASSESLKDEIVPSRSAPELPAAALQAQESPTGALSNKSMRSTNSGGAEFELALLRRECDGLRKALDDSTRREQGLAAQLRAHRVLQEQAADGRVTPLAILDAVPQARGGEATVALHPDSSFLSPLLQLIGDAACVEVMLTAFTYDDPELTSAATAAKLRGANVRLLIDLQKAHACKESGKILQQLLDAQVEVRTTCGKSLSDVYGGSFRGFKGALHAKTALIRSRASDSGEDRVVLFIGSHNLTKASRANREFVTELRFGSSDTRVASYRAWYESMWSGSEGLR